MNILMKNNIITLATCKVNLLKRGDIEVIWEYVEPDKFIEVMDECKKDHPNTHIFASVIRHAVMSFNTLNDDLKRLLRNI